MSLKKRVKVKHGLTAYYRRKMTITDWLEFANQNLDKWVEEGTAKKVPAQSDGVYIKSEATTDKYIIEITADIPNIPKE